MSINPISLLRAARSLLVEPENWHKGNYTPQGLAEIGNNCPHCLIGAIFASAQGDLAGTADAIRRVGFAIKNKKHDFTSIAKFNDHPDTTHAEILEVLDTAIKGK